MVLQEVASKQQIYCVLVLLSLTAGFHQYLQEKIIDMTRAVIYKNMIYDTRDSLKEKRSDATSARFHDMAICKATQIPGEGQSSGQRRKMKPKEKFDPVSLWISKRR